MTGEDSDSNTKVFVLAVIVVGIALYKYTSKLQQFEQNVKTFFFSFFTIRTAIIFSLIILPIITTLIIYRRIKNKREAIESEKIERAWRIEFRKQEKLKKEEEKRRLEEELRQQEAERKRLLKGYRGIRKRFRKSKIVLDKKVYLEDDLGEADKAFLFSEDKFIRVSQNNLSGEKEDYIVFQDKFESPNHIICVNEIVDYIKQFTQDIKTYRTVMPDIVFTCEDKKYAIEVETGKVLRDKQKMENKLKLLKERFNKNWFFFVTNRNMEREYAKLGEVSTKRNIKSKIDKLFRNSWS